MLEEDLGLGPVRPDGTRKDHVGPVESGSAERGTADAGDSVPAGSKGIWVWSSTIRGHEPAFAAWLTQHSYTDVFVLFKGTSGMIKHDVLDALMGITAKSGQGVRVWAWMAGLSDASHASPSWTYLVGNWVSPECVAYRDHLISTARAAIDPSQGKVSRVPDGLMLDDSFQWPSQLYGKSMSNRVQTLVSLVDAIKAELAGVHKSTGKKILLGFAPHPETAVHSKAPGSVATYSAFAYGQDMGQLAKRCDWIVPETYRYGHYGNQPSWIGTVVGDIAKEIALECPGRSGIVKVFPALVLYLSDAAPTAVAAVDLGQDRAVALAVAGGLSVFRYASHFANPGSGLDGDDWPTAAQSVVLDQ